MVFGAGSVPGAGWVVRHGVAEGPTPKAPVQAPVNEECYNAMLAVVLRGDPDFVAHAMEAIAEMRSRGLRPRTDTFNTVMQSAVNNADFLQARPPSRRNAFSPCMSAHPTPLRAVARVPHRGHAA